MTLPDDEPRGKPVRRRWLFAPYILLLFVAIVWSAGWFWLRLSATRELEQGAERLRAAGYDVAWATQAVGGYPFRLTITLTDARIGEPSGWALSAPQAKAEAAIYALGRWTFVAPREVVLHRPQGGPVRITGNVLRASASSLDTRPPHIILEGVGVTFTPQDGGAAYPFTRADRMVMELRPGPDDQAALLLSVENAEARFTGLLARVAQDRPVSLNWESILTGVSGFRGDNWPAAVQAWTAAGGAIRVRTAGITAGDAVLNAKSGALTVGPDGRLRGALQVDLREAGAAQQLGGAEATINFADGQTLLGPLPVGPALRVY